MIDLYFYFLKQNRVSTQVTIESGANVQYTIDCIKLGDDGFKSNSYMRINSEFLEDGLKEVLRKFDMLETFENRYVKVMNDKNKFDSVASGNTVQITQTVGNQFAYRG